MRRLTVPTNVATLAHDPATLLLVSISGGKDSQAMLAAVAATRRREGWPCRIAAVHADLGAEVEWPESLPHCRRICADLGIELHVVGYEGGLMRRMEKRLINIQTKGEAKVFWPSPSQRYCTSDTKRNPIDSLVKKLVPNGGKVIQAIGLRADESEARAAQPECYPMTVARMASRDAVGWHPIIDWDIRNVWAACGTSVADVQARRDAYARGDKRKALAGSPIHPAYVYGNDRVSCVYCIMGSKNDLAVGYREHPEMLDNYLDLERRSGHTFKHGWSLERLTEATA